MGSTPQNREVETDEESARGVPRNTEAVSEAGEMDPYFRTACGDFLASALDQLQQELALGQAPVRQVCDVWFAGDEGYAREWKTIPDLPLLSARLKGKLLHVPAADVIIEYFKSGKLGSDLFSTPGQSETEQVWNFFLLRFLHTYLINRPTLEFDSESFSAIYLGWERGFYRDTVRSVSMAPLFGFISSVDRVVLEPDLLVRRLTTAERTEFLRYSNGSPLLSDTDIHWLHFGVEASAEVPKSRPVSDQSVRIRQVISMMRLITSHRISTRFIRLSSDPPFLWHAITGGYQSAHQVVVEPMTTPYGFKKNEVDSLTSYWKHLNSFEYSQRERYLLALDRFSSTFEESKVDDQIVDCWIAFETLFDLSVSRGKGQKLASRIAQYIKSTTATDQMRRARKALETSYRVRDFVVHGSRDRRPESAPSMDVLEVGRSTREYLGRALRVSLEEHRLPTYTIYGIDGVVEPDGV